MKKFFLLIIFSLISFNHYSFAECLKGTCVEGEGTMTFPDGKKFEGSFLNNLLHGQGTMTFPNEKKIYRYI